MLKVFIAEDDEGLVPLLPAVIRRMMPGTDVTILSDPLLAATTLQVMFEKGQAEWPNVVISDFHQFNDPQASGNFLLKYAAQLFPDARLILMSGGATKLQIEETRKAISKEVHFLQKPFDMQAFIDVVKGKTQ